MVVQQIKMILHGKTQKAANWVGEYICKQYI